MRPMRRLALLTSGAPVSLRFQAAISSMWRDMKIQRAKVHAPVRPRYPAVR